MAKGRFAETCCVLVIMNVRTFGVSGTSIRPSGSVSPSDCLPSQTSNAVATWKIFGHEFEAVHRSRTPWVRPVIGSVSVAYENGKS